MVDPIGLIKYFSSANTSVSQRTFWGIFIVIAILLIDNSLSFSYYYNTEHKIQQVENLNDIMSDTSLSATDRDYLSDLRQDIIYRETLKERAENFLSDFQFKEEEKSIIQEKEELRDVRIVDNRDPTWHFISSAWIFFILFLFVPGMTIKQRTSQSTVFGMVFSIIVMGVLLFGAAVLVAKLLSSVPILFGDPVFNYVLNSIASFLLVLVVTFFTNWIVGIKQI